MAIFSIALRGGVILEELILRMSLSGRAILHCILPRDYILSYAPCRGSVSWEIHLSKGAILEQLISNISLLEIMFTLHYITLQCTVYKNKYMLCMDKFISICPKTLVSMYTYWTVQGLFTPVACGWSSLANGRAGPYHGHMSPY